MVLERAPTPRERYIAATIPQAITSSNGFARLYAIVRRTFLDSYALPTWESVVGDLATAVGFGVLAEIVRVAFVVVIRVVRWVSGLVRSRYISGLVSAVFHPTPAQANRSSER